MSTLKMIQFDSNDWNSIQDTIDKINEIGSLQFGKTDEGEHIVFDVANFGDEDCLVTVVYQHNGWVRKNIYHPNTGEIEEIYKKEE